MYKFIFLIFLGFFQFAEAQIYDHHSFKKFKAPEREFSIIVGNEGYFPDRLIVFEGEKVRFFVTSNAQESKCFIIQNTDVFVPAHKGKITEAETVFDKAGEFSFYCPSFNHTGKIVVLGERERSQPVVKVNRDPASSSNLEQNEQGWVPREY